MKKIGIILLVLYSVLITSKAVELIGVVEETNKSNVLLSQTVVRCIDDIQGITFY